MQPDTLIPDPSNPQGLNRYSYVSNSPINFNDPTGHEPKGPGSCYDYDSSTGDCVNLGLGGNNNGGGDNTDGDEKGEGGDAGDKPSFGICIAGGVINRDPSGSGTDILCQGLIAENKIDDYRVIANSEWYSFYTNNTELLVDYNLVIIGYSNGGEAAMELAYYLDSVDRDVSQLVLIDPVRLGAGYRTIPGNVENSYLLLEDGKESRPDDYVADLFTHNNYVHEIGYITHILNANHGNIDELSTDILLLLLP